MAQNVTAVAADGDVIPVGEAAAIQCGAAAAATIPGCCMVTAAAIHAEATLTGEDVATGPTTAAEVAAGAVEAAVGDAEDAEAAEAAAATIGIVAEIVAEIEAVITNKQLP